MRMTVLMLALVASACVPIASNEECFVDSDCGGSLECSRTNECESAGSLRTIRLTWTVNGLAPTLMTPEPCAPVAELEVTFRDLTSGEDVTFRPVTCALGLATYDKFSPRFTAMVLAAYDNDDRVLDIETRSIGPGENIVEIDLVP
jgi:hypothetical protein